MWWLVLIVYFLNSCQLSHTSLRVFVRMLEGSHNWGETSLNVGTDGSPCPTKLTRQAKLCAQQHSSPPHSQCTWNVKDYLMFLPCFPAIENCSLKLLFKHPPLSFSFPCMCPTIRKVNIYNYIEYVVFSCISYHRDKNVENLLFKWNIFNFGSTASLSILRRKEACIHSLVF